MARMICPGVPTVVSTMFGTAEGRTFKGLIDTGAEISFLPRQVVAEFGIGVRGSISVVGIGREPENANLAVLVSEVPPFPTRALQVAVTDQQWVGFDLIVGMDYLIQFDLAIRQGTFGPI